MECIVDLAALKDVLIPPWASSLSSADGLGGGEDAGGGLGVGEDGGGGGGSLGGMVLSIVETMSESLK